MVEFIYDEEKESWLNEHRGVSFKQAIAKIEAGEARIIANPNQRKYSGEEAYILKIDGYNLVVPYERKGRSIRLKTIYKNRKINKRYRNENS